MAEAKKFPTPAMLKAREAWAKKPEADKEAFWQKFEGELRILLESLRKAEGRRSESVCQSAEDFLYLVETFGNGDARVVKRTRVDYANIHDTIISEDEYGNQQAGGQRTYESYGEERLGLSESKDDVAYGTSEYRTASELDESKSEGQQGRNVGEGEGSRESDVTYSPDYAYWRNALKGDSEPDNVDVDVDVETESVNPGKFSMRTWNASEYVQNRNAAAKEIAQAIGVSEKKAKQYIDDVNSIAYMIANEKGRLGYDETGLSPFVSNAEYGGSFDFTTLCKKRRLLTGTFSEIQKALKNTALTAQEILDIRKMMDDAGLEVSCGKCYVEGSRANMGQFTKQFIELYKKYNPGKWYPNMAEMNTPDGIEWVRITHPEVYEQ